MDLDIKLTEEKDNNSKDRVKKAQQSKQDSEFQPTWEEVWTTGYTRPTGTFKKAIFQAKNTDADLNKLYQVKEAVEEGLLGTGVENLKKFTKTHALRLYNDLKEIKREQIAKEMIENKPDNYYTVLTSKELDRLQALMYQEDTIAVDTETTGLKWEDVTVGISVTLPKADKHFYIPYGHTIVKQLDREDVFSKLKGPLEREGLKGIFFNSKFDAHMLKKDGIDVRGNIYFDAMIVMHLLNENEPSYALKNLANKYGKFFGYDTESMKFDELFGKDPQDFINADIELASIYACKDTHLTYLFYEWQMKHLEKHPELKDLYFNIEQPITKVALEMEDNGFEIDEDFAKQYEKELRLKLEELNKELHENWGDINTNSPKQLKEKLFDELGYKDISGKGSTDARVLKQLAKEHDDVKVLLEYRDLSKLHGTYIKPLPTLLRKDILEYGIKGDGRLHGSFNQSGTVTGRFSSSSPNIQNIGPKARRMFIAPKGKLLIGIDYSGLMYVWL